MLRPITKEEFARLFDSFENSAFRLESLDQYAVSGEVAEYARFLAGEELPVSGEGDWTRLIKKRVSEGKVMQRVHVIPTPLTPYLKFEIYWGYVHNSVAGEQIYLIERESVSPEVLDTPDFWLFDRKTLVIMRYDADGHFLHAERDDSSTTLEIYGRMINYLLSSSTPLKSFLSRDRSSCK
jgi:hypothetical protein